MVCPLLHQFLLWTNVRCSDEPESTVCHPCQILTTLVLGPQKFLDCAAASDKCWLGPNGLRIGRKNRIDRMVSERSTDPMRLPSNTLEPPANALCNST